MTREVNEPQPPDVLAAIPDVVFVIDEQGTVRYANDAVARVLGLDDWHGMSVLDLVHPDDLSLVVSSIGAVQGKATGTPIEVRVRDRERGWRWMEVIGVDRLDTGAGGIVCVARDVTARRMWEVAAGDITRFQQVVQHAPSITLLLDGSGRISSVNGAFTRLLGHDPSLVVGRELANFASVDGVARLTAALGRVLRDGSSTSVEVPMRLATRPGAERPVRFEFVNLLDDPVVQGIIVTGHDVSDLRDARAELEHLAHHDALTGLANRTLLLDTMRGAIEARQPLAVVFIDLDRFKPVNDLLGHDAGDELLRSVAQRLDRTVRPGDLVARVGGDEFVVVAPGVVNRRTAASLGERIERALAEPYVLTAGPVRIGASVGLAVSDPTSTVAGLLADADLNMYDVKADRRGEIPRSMEERRRTATQRRRLADDLATGIERGEINAHLQPIVDLESGEVVAFEALARWAHPVLGPQPPSSFMEVATDANLDLPLGHAVARSACSTMARLRDRASARAAAPEIPVPRLALNLSVGQLCDPNLVGELRHTLGDAGLTLEDLIVEVTERATLPRAVGAGEASPESVLGDLHQLGAELSLDDFGTGHSSLTHVRRFPLSYLKVDRSFVDRMTTHVEDRAVVSAVIGLARALGLGVVAEGVEHETQVAELRRLGCHHGQGFLLGQPMEPDEVVAWYDAQLARLSTSASASAIERRGRGGSDHGQAF